MFEVIRFPLKVLFIKKDTQLYCIHSAYNPRQEEHHISKSDNHTEQYHVRIILNKHIREL